MGHLSPQEETIHALHVTNRRLNRRCQRAECLAKAYRRQIIDHRKRMEWYATKMKLTVQELVQLARRERRKAYPSRPIIWGHGYTSMASRCPYCIAKEMAKWAWQCVLVAIGIRKAVP